jgi:cystathionine beta-synthase/cysteine synthase A
MMMNPDFQEGHLYSFDDRRDMVIAGDAAKANRLGAELFVKAARQAITSHGTFAVALTGGSTPKTLYSLLAASPFREQVDWSKVFLFWSDERCVPPTHSESNYRMAMEAGFNTLPIPKAQIFRMHGEHEDVEQAALDYEALIKKHTYEETFDLVLLGVGEDGHIASLFPKTHGLHTDQPRLAIANYILQKEIWRLSLTYYCINSSHQILLLALGKSKTESIKRIFSEPYDPDQLPAQKVGTRHHKALWIMDREAGKLLLPDSANHYPKLLDIVGRTPLVKLQSINPYPLATILVKLEYLNPAGSVKDRIVRYIIDDAEKRGLLKPGGTIIESTSGNTGAAVAMIAAIKGYRAILTMPDKVSIEKQNSLKAYGAEIVIAPTSAPVDSPEHYVNIAKKLAAEIPNSFRVNQYDNLKNPEAHYFSTGPEIWEQTKGKIDVFVSSASTGGTVSGAGKFLKEKNPALKIVMPDPIGSVYYDYFKTGKIPEGGNCNYLVEGIGEDHVTKAIDFSLIDEVIQVTDKDAFDTARLLARREGILAGGSSGANVWGALEIAKRAVRPTVIATIIADGGVKYLSKFFDDAWLQQHKLK